MTQPHRTVSPAPLSDPDWFDGLIAEPGGVAALQGDDWSRLGRVLADLPVARLIDLAGTAAPRDTAALSKVWLALHPAAAEAPAVWFNLGVALLQSGEAAEAATAYSNALTLRPDFHTASVNLGLALESAGDRAAAMAAWRRSLPEAEDRRFLHVHLGRMLEEDGNLSRAAAELRAALLIEPDQPDVKQHLVHMRQRMADWPVTGSDIPGAPPADLARHCGPLGALALHDDPVLQREINAAWIARKLPPVGVRLAPVAGYAHDRIRVGYLSTDFCCHAMSFLIAELLERHDRSCFEIYGYCASPEDGSPIRARVLAALDHHVPVGALDDAAAAARIRQDEIDILIDLNGLTRGARLGVLRWKPAPVQATYLGYIGPVPLPELDWIITDRVAIPPGEATHYAPAPLYLDGCFQANDGRVPELPEVSRQGEGLPEDAFVFCCFSHHYKITPEVFGAWLRIVSATPGAVLWLVEDGATSTANLRARWGAAGLDPSRLIFAPRVDPARYRARMALGDLFLDTSPYNAGTIASDALRMGLPLLTFTGRAFVARMAASLLTAMGLPELIASDLEDYTRRAIALAADPGAMAVLRTRCGAGPWTRTLGDAADFTRRLEDAYRQIRLHPCLTPERPAV